MHVRRITHANVNTNDDELHVSQRAPPTMLSRLKGILPERAFARGLSFAPWSAPWDRATRMPIERTHRPSPPLTLRPTVRQQKQGRMMTEDYCRDNDIDGGSSNRAAIDSGIGRDRDASRAQTPSPSFVARHGHAIETVHF